MSLFATIKHETRIHIFQKLSTRVSTTALENFFCQYPVRVFFQNTEDVLSWVLLSVREAEAPCLRPCLELSEDEDRTLTLRFLSNSRDSFRVELQQPTTLIDVLQTVVKIYSEEFPWCVRFRTDEGFQRLSLGLPPLPMSTTIMEQEQLASFVLVFQCGDTTLAQCTFHAQQSNPKKRPWEALSHSFSDVPAAKALAEKVQGLKRLLLRTIISKDRAGLGVDGDSEGAFSDLRDWLPPLRGLERMISPEALDVLRHMSAVLEAAAQTKKWHFFVSEENDLFELGLGSDAVIEELRLEDLPPKEFNCISQSRRRSLGGPLFRYEEGNEFAEVIQKRHGMKLLAWCSFHFESSLGWVCDLSGRNFRYNEAFYPGCSPYRVLRLVMVLIMRLASLLLPIPFKQSDRISLVSDDRQDRAGHLTQYHIDTLALKKKPERLTGRVTRSIRRLENLCGVHLMPSLFSFERESSPETSSQSEDLGSQSPNSWEFI